MALSSPDTPGVKVLPPLIWAGVFVVAYAAQRALPLRLWGDPPPAARLLGWGLVVAALALAASAAFLFRRAGTPPHPGHPTTALVMRGPYRVTRNPMYVGLCLLYLGLALLVNSFWPLLLFPVVILLAQRWVIVHEEAYLERKFGDEYRTYKMRVRRWL